MEINKDFVGLVGHGIEVAGYGYTPTALHADDAVGRLELMRIDENYARETVRVEGPVDPTGKYFTFSLDGHDFLFDLINSQPHCLTTPIDESDRREYAPGVLLIGGKLLRIEKECAEQNLSPVCLELATTRNAQWYQWDEFDRWMPVFEIPSVFRENFMEVLNNLRFYCDEYIRRCGLDENNVADTYRENYYRWCNTHCDGETSDTMFPSK